VNVSGAATFTGDVELPRYTAHFKGATGWYEFDNILAVSINGKGIQFGPNTSNSARIFTDLARYDFDKPIFVNGTEVGGFPAHNAIGDVVLAVYFESGNTNPVDHGDLVSGSRLAPTNVNGDNLMGGLFGTYRCCGQTGGSSSNNGSTTTTTIWRRVA